MAKRRSKKPVPVEASAMPFNIRQYEQSTEWKNKSKALLSNRDCKCAICGRARWKEYKRNPGTYKRVLKFSVHHITYKNVPNEKPEDLMTLCVLCHNTCHDILRYKQIGPFYMALAKVVWRYGFKYDKHEEEKDV